MIVKVLAAAALLAALVAASAPPAPPIRHSGTFRGDPAEIIPPERYQGDVGAIVIFGNRDVIAGMCGAPNAQGVGPIACTHSEPGTVPIIAFPNPCLFAAKDVYAALLCHEVGHANQWPATHGD